MSVAEIRPRGGDDDAYGRTPPHDIAAEQCVLGGMLLSKDAVLDVVETIRPDDHYRPAHQIVHEAILELHDRNEPADAVSVAHLLTKRGDLSRIGGAPYLHTLLASVPTAANAGYYARIVREKALLRRLIDAATRIAQMGYEGSGEATELIDRARAELDNADRPVAEDGVQALDDVLMDVLASLEGQEQRGLPTPWTDLNALVNGLAAGEMEVIAGRPGIGKSVAGLGIAANAALHHGIQSVIFSMEMTRAEIMMRLISSEGRVPLYSLLRRRLTDDDWNRVVKAKDKILGAPLLIDDTPGCTLAHIRSRLRRMARTTPVGLVVVDYLQLLSGAGRAENRQTEVAGFSRGLKLIAGEFGIPVVALSQLNRSPAHRSDRRPELSDLRESGAIENDASVVVLLHREDAYERESPRAGEIDMIVAKNRNGPLATVTEAFQGEYARIVDMAPSRPGYDDVVDLDERRGLK